MFNVKTIIVRLTRINITALGDAVIKIVVNCIFAANFINGRDTGFWGKWRNMVLGFSMT